MTFKDYIPWIISFLSLVLCFVTFLRNNKKDFKKEIADDALKIESIKESLLKVNMKLDTLCATTQETRVDIKAMKNDMQALDIRVAVLERDLKTAYSRIDELRGEVRKERA